MEVRLLIQRVNSMRRYPDAQANGEMFNQESIVEVRWKWIIAHAILIAFCVLFLVSTMIVTRSSILGGATWKSSTSALLRALSPGLQKDFQGISKRFMEASDRKQRVRIINVDDEGWRIVAQ